MKFISTLFLILLPFCSFSQDSGYAKFQVDTVACINQNVIYKNQSTLQNGIFEWDFCAGDLAEQPNLIHHSTISSLNKPRGIKTIFDGTHWYSFITNRNKNSLIRLYYGADLNQNPEVEAIENELFYGPQEISFIHEDNNWFAIVVNQFNNSAVLLNFGLSLLNSPQLTNLQIPNLKAPKDIVIKKNNNIILAFIANFGSKSLTRVNFGNSILNSQFETTQIDGSSYLSQPQGIDLIKYGNNWYGVVTSFGNKKMFLMDFGNSLLNLPISTEITTFDDWPLEIQLLSEGDSIFALVTTDVGDLINFRFDKYFNLHSINNYGNYDIVSSLYGLSTARQNSTWFVFGVDSENKAILKYAFPTQCDNFITANTGTNVKNIYANSGEYLTTLTVSGDSERFTYSKKIIIENVVSPLVEIENDLIACNADSIYFNSTSQGISFEWNFGDGPGTSNEQNPQYQYQNPGSYLVTLNVEAENGCSNSTRDSIHIYDSPTSDFSFPSTVICSNSEIDFVNQTTFTGPDSLLTYSWNINDEITSNEIDPSHTFISGGDKTVTLTASIPGCSSETSQIISITPGPLTSFTFDGTCAYDQFSFTNNTTGDNISGYQWDFGDGYFSTSVSPVHNFAKGENYVVSLTASNALGCNTTLQQVVPVRYRPQANFNNQILACSDKSITLDDLTTVIDANITDQQWKLEQNEIGYSQSASGSSVQFNLENEGDYLATLISESNYGCLDTLSKAISVSPSPIADFQVDYICYGDSAIFIASPELPEGAGVLSADWFINGQPFSGEDIKYKFSNTGEQRIELYLKADNLCNDYIQKSININPLPEIDFNLSAFCEDELVSIQSNFLSPNDPVTNFQWLVNKKAISNQESFSYEFKKADDYSINLSVSTENDCNTSINKLVTINPKPTSKFDVFPSFGASPLEVKFTDRSSDADKVKYMFSNHNEDEGNKDDPIYTYTQIGEDIATQIVSNQYGCNDTSIQTIEVVIPTYDISITDVSSKVVDGEIQFFINLENNGTIILNDPKLEIKIGKKAALSQRIEASMMPGESIEYHLDINLLQNSFQDIGYVCFSASDELGGLIDLNSYDNQQCIHIDQLYNLLEPFPNPATYYVEIPIILPSNGDCDIQLIGEQGNIVYAKKFANLNEGLNMIKMYLTPYRKGVYVINVKMSDFESSKKLVIQ